MWVSFAGGSAINLTLNGGAGAHIIGWDQSHRSFEMIKFMLSPTLATLMSMSIVVLLMTYLVASAVSAVLIINTIAGVSDESPKGWFHIIIWGIILTVVIADLLLTKSYGLGAINTVIIIEALPFSVVMALMGNALIKALVRNGMRNAALAKTPTKAAE